MSLGWMWLLIAHPSVSPKVSHSPTPQEAQLRACCKYRMEGAVPDVDVLSRRPVSVSKAYKALKKFLRKEQGKPPEDQVTCSLHNLTKHLQAHACSTT